MKRRWLGWALPPLVFGLVPAVVERTLVAWLHDGGAAGVMLGAVSGASLESVAATLLALVLRLYVVVALPGLAAYWLVTRVLSPRGSSSARPSPGPARPTSTFRH
jgi:hypothetical protein